MTHYIIAVDPGDVHVGVAIFGREQEQWQCTEVFEMQPEEFEEWLTDVFQQARADIRALVVESFGLFPDKAAQQAGSQMPTAQLIGAIKYIRRRLNYERQGGIYVELVMQQPDIKKPAFAICRKSGYEFTADRLEVPGQHVRDAEVHGVKYIRDKLKEPVKKRATSPPVADTWIGADGWWAEREPIDSEATTV